MVVAAHVHTVRGREFMMTKTGIAPTRLIALLCCGLVAGVSASPLASAAPRVRLIETGEFHGDEVRARTGEQWLGLYVARTDSALSPTIVRVKRVHDPIVDGQPGERTGKRVTVRRRPEPVFLVREAGMLHPGKVTTVYHGETPLNDHSDVRLTVAGKTYHLRVTTRSRQRSEHSSDERLSDDARLVLATGKSRQVLYSLAGKSNDEGEWNLLWAGDLDHDGRLDLYVEVSWHYNLSQRKLFLSSQAKRGRLVREVADFSTEGC
jgi:hypothetical protein